MLADVQPVLLGPGASTSRNGDAGVRLRDIAFETHPEGGLPLMARRGGETALRDVNEFRTATGAVWPANLMPAAVLVTWFPHLLFRKDDAEMPIALWSGAACLVAVFVLLCAAGRAAQHGSILTGEIAILLMLFPLVRMWRLRHG